MPQCPRWSPASPRSTTSPSASAPAARTLRDARTRAYEALEEVGLLELAKRAASGLSGGERQRVALARALATGAPLIVADEPTANLDEANAIKVAEFLADRARQGACVVCATHDASVTARASAVIAMRDGRVAPGAGGAQAPRSDRLKTSDTFTKGVWVFRGSGQVWTGSLECMCSR